MRNDESDNYERKGAYLIIRNDFATNCALTELGIVPPLAFQPYASGCERTPQNKNCVSIINPGFLSPLREYFVRFT